MVVASTCGSKWNTALRYSASLRRKAVALILLGFASDSGLAAPTHALNYGDLASIRYVYNGDVSPDGRWLAYEVDGREIWIVGLHGGSPPKKVGDGSFPKWSPDSRHLAYYGSKDSFTQLTVYSTAGDRANVVTQMEGGVDPDTGADYVGLGAGNESRNFSWSPDSKEIVFSSRVSRTHGDHAAPALAMSGKPEEGLPLVFNGSTPPNATLVNLFRGGDAPRLEGGKLIHEEDKGPSEGKVDQLFIVNVQTEELRQLTSDDAVYFSPDWSPDGRLIVCVSMEGKPFSGYFSGPTNLYLIDPTSGNKTALTTDKSVYKREPKWSPDGRRVAYKSQKESHDNAVSVIAAGGGQPIAVTEHLSEDPEQFVWETAASIAVQSLFGRTRSIYHIDISSRVPAGPKQDAAYRWLLGASRNGVLVWSQNDFGGPARVYGLAAGSSKPFLIVNLNPQIESWKIGKQELVNWKNSRGEELDGILLRPVDYVKGRRYPLIVDAYPMTSVHFLGNYGEGNQLWASHGYAVFYPASRGPHMSKNSFRSKTFDEAASGPSGIDVMVDDIMTGIDELVREGIVDSDRMCLFGFSNGGAVVNYLVTRTQRFKCAVVQSAAISVDWVSPFLLHTLWRMPPALAGATPWDDPELWMKLSTVFMLNKVATPMLLAVGDNEEAGVFAAIELYNGLRYLGRDVTLLRYPHQGHGFSGAADEDFFERQLKFFDRHLRANAN